MAQVNCRQTAVKEKNRLIGLIKCLQITFELRKHRRIIGGSSCGYLWNTCTFKGIHRSAIYNRLLNWRICIQIALFAGHRSNYVWFSSIEWCIVNVYVVFVWWGQV